MLQEQKQLEKHKLLQSKLPPLMGVKDMDDEMDIDKSRNLLEWELSTLEAGDLRSHAWYHGNRVNREKAEWLLRKYVATEYGVTDIKEASIKNVTKVVSREGDEEMEEVTEDYSDGLDDVSSDSDFNKDDVITSFVDEHDVASRSSMAMDQPEQKRLRMDGNPNIPVDRRRRHYYCFLVRDSSNVRPPGRYVMSCLRVCNYDNGVNDNRNLTYGDGIMNDEKREKFLRRQHQRRVHKQQQQQVLHFVINEVSAACVTYFCIVTLKDDICIKYFL